MRPLIFCQHTIHHVIWPSSGTLDAGFISVCLETRWLDHFGGFYLPEPYCHGSLKPHQ